MNCIGTYDGTIFYNPANKFCIVSVKTADQSVPAEARSNRRYKDHLIRFTAVGYEIPRTDAVELELDGEWTKGKYGVQLQVEQWREIVPRTKNGVEGYLASGLIKGIGPKTAADIVERFGVATLDILEHQPERLLEIRGITENKLEDIRASYAENRMLQGIMTLLAPFKITPKTALKIYQYFGPTSVEILEKSPFELCQISGFGFRRVDAIVQKSGGDLHDPNMAFYTLPILVPMDQYYEIIQNFGEDRAVYNYRTYMNLLVEDGLDAEVQAQAEQICGTYLGTSDFYTSSKTQRALDRERLTDATMLIVYSLTALFGIIGISSAAVAILNSLYQRRKEFAMLRSVGLDRKGLDRLLHIEGFFLGGKPLVIGLPILFLIVAVLMWMQDVTFMEFIQVFPLLGLAAYIVLVLMVISGIYRAASRRIRRDIIVEALKDENV